MKSIHNSLYEWKKADPKAYNNAEKQGLIPKICEILGWEIPIRKRFSGGRKYWTLERCMEIAIKFNAKTEWYKADPISYRNAIKNGFMDKCSEHMVEKLKPVGFWGDKQKVITEARKFDSVRLFAKHSSGAYHSAIKNGWLEECKEHMGHKHKANGYWKIKENVLNDALTYKTHNEWRIKSGSAEYSARIHGWIEEATAHMIKVEPKKKVKKGYWKIKENVLKEVENFSSSTEWNICSGGSLLSAKKNGWYDECIEIIKNNKINLE